MKNIFLIDVLILFFLGVLSSLSLPPFNFYIINFFTFSYLFIFLFKKLNILNSKKYYFSYGWFFGFGYFLTSLYWISISLTYDDDFSFLIPISFFLIPAFFAIFYGLVTLIFFILNFKNNLSSFFLFCLLLGIVEFIRGNILTGFPWNLIVYSFSENLNLISFISVIGTYSLNLLVISLFTIPSIYFLRKSKKEIIVCIVFLLIPIFLLMYGLFYKHHFLKNEIKKNPYTLRVIASNISLDRFYDNIQPELVIKELIDISSPEPNKAIFFLWPEGIIPNTFQDEINIYDDIFIKNFDNNHLIGLGITSRSFENNKNKYFNSFSIFDNNLNLIDSYNKKNLVPFGEFLPLENYLNDLGLSVITNNFGSFTRGYTREIIQIRNGLNYLKFLPLICYEIIYTGALSKNSDYDLILNISEDGWFGKSIGPKQHFVHSIFRAVESGKYVVRSSNNGRAAIVNPLGVIEKSIDYGNEGFIDFKERREMETTIFSIYGNKIFLLLILLYIFLVFSFNRNKNE